METIQRVLTEVLILRGEVAKLKARSSPGGSLSSTHDAGVEFNVVEVQSMRSESLTPKCALTEES